MEPILLGAGHVEDVFIAAAVIGGSCTPGHDVGVDIDRVDRIGHGHRAVYRKDLLYVATVALGPIRDKDLLRFDRHVSRGVVIRRDEFS